MRFLLVHPFSYFLQNEITTFTVFDEIFGLYEETPVDRVWDVAVT